MSINKVVANNMNEGLRLVKDRFGDEALILKTVKRQGKVELFVEVEDPEIPEENLRIPDGALSEPQVDLPLKELLGEKGLEVSGSAEIQEQYRQARIKMLTALGERPSSTPAPEVKPEPLQATRNLNSFDHILNSIQTSVETQGLSNERTAASLIESLQLSAPVAAQLRGYRRLDEVIAGLSTMIRCDNGFTPGIRAYVGPAGSGKTTSLLKLVTRQVMQFGPEKCAMINCDRYRPGADEQLQRLGRLMDVEVLTVNDRLGLDEALDKVKHRDYVAIDMPGLGLREPRLQQEMFRLTASRHDIKRYLVLPANLQPGVMEMAASVCASRQNSSVILTHLDECDSLGPAISFLVHKQFNLAFLSHGRHVPDDLVTGRSDELVQKAMSLVDQGFAKAQMSDLTNSSNNQSSPSFNSMETPNKVMDV